MSTEARLTQRFLVALKLAAPSAVVLKFNDRTTSGLPDACVTENGRTIWLEFKRDKIDKWSVLQAQTLLRLSKASHGRAFYVVFVEGKVRLVRILDPTFDLNAVAYAFSVAYEGTQSQIINTIKTLCH